MVIPLLYSICRSELGTMGQWVDLVVSSTPPPFYIWIPSFMTMSGWVTTPLTPCSASMVCYGEIAKVSVHLLWVRHCAQQLTCIISLTLHNNLLGWNCYKWWNCGIRMAVELPKVIPASRLALHQAFLTLLFMPFLITQCQYLYPHPSGWIGSLLI